MKRNAVVTIDTCHDTNHLRVTQSLLDALVDPDAPSFICQNVVARIEIEESFLLELAGIEDFDIATLDDVDVPNPSTSVVNKEEDDAADLLSANSDDAARLGQKKLDEPGNHSPEMPRNRCRRNLGVQLLVWIIVLTASAAIFYFFIASAVSPDAKTGDLNASTTTLASC